MRVEGHKLIAECTAYDFKSEKVNAHLDPLPEWSLIPHEIEGKDTLLPQSGRDQEGLYEKW